jgi:hypothetical protein
MSGTPIRSLAVLLLTVASFGALAQGQPAAASAQPALRLIVPFTPGTGIDLIARTVGPRLAERLGRPVVVDNRAGASGNIGTEAVVRAAPNGQTLLVSVNTLVMNRSLYPKLPFDPVKDLVPVSLTSWGQLLLVAPPAAASRRRQTSWPLRVPNPAASTTRRPAWARPTICPWNCSSPRRACSSPTSPTAAPARP